MRVAVVILVFLNLAFFAWAVWIDSPPPASAAQSGSKLPRLVLASEAQPKSKTASAPTAPRAARCVSVGPFNTAERVAAAGALLQQRGLGPRQREEKGETIDGYWVYVGGLKSAFDEARVLHTLDQAGLSDARVMPESDAGRRVSVGVFSEHVRAERRARVLRRLGLEPEIAERRVPSVAYWIDLNLGANDETVSTEGLLSPEESGARLEVRVCPAVQSPPASG